MSYISSEISGKLRREKFNKANPSILAIDPGGTMGWALFHQGVLTSGVEQLTKPHESYGLRLIRLEKFLAQYDQI